MSEQARARLLWTALFFAPLTYLMVLQVAARPTEPADEIIRWALLAASVIGLGWSIFLPRILHRARVRKSQEFVTEEVDDLGAPRGFRVAAPKKRVLQDPKRAFDHATKLYFTPMIVGLAMAESIAVQGLLLGIMGFAPPVYLPHFAVGWLAMLPHFPSREKIVSVVEKETGVTFPKEA